MECVIPSHHHRVVIGTKWSNINELSQRFNVSIKFPERTPSAQPTAQEGLSVCLSVCVCLFVSVYSRHLQGDGTCGNPMGMETSVAGFPWGWNKIGRDSRANVPLFDFCGAVEDKTNVC